MKLFDILIKILHQNISIMYLQSNADYQFVDSHRI